MAELPTDTATATTHDEAAAYDAWFRAKVEKAMASTAPRIPHDQVMAGMWEIIERAKTK